MHLTKTSIPLGIKKKTFYFLVKLKVLFEFTNVVLRAAKQIYYFNIRNGKWEGKL